MPLLPVHIIDLGPADRLAGYSIRETAQNHLATIEYEFARPGWIIGRSCHHLVGVGLRVSFSGDVDRMACASDKILDDEASVFSLAVLSPVTEMRGVAG